jgi:hypothetical protein
MMKIAINSIIYMIFIFFESRSMVKTEIQRFRAYVDLFALEAHFFGVKFRARFKVNLTQPVV